MARTKETVIIARCDNCDTSMRMIEDRTPEGWFYFGKTADGKKEAIHLEYCSEKCAVESIAIRTNPRVGVIGLSKPVAPSKPRRISVRGAHRTDVGVFNRTRIFEVIENSKVFLTTDEIVEFVGDLDSTTVRKHLDALIEEGKVTLTNAGPYSRWNPKQWIKA